MLDRLGTSGPILGLLCYVGLQHNHDEISMVKSQKIVTVTNWQFIDKGLHR